MCEAIGKPSMVLFKPYQSKWPKEMLSKSFKSGEVVKVAKCKVLPPG